ncbi:arrestin domain-containing protein 3-like isoform X2 [Trachinotus anak]|uniref:arrestin domain-containing protein 3-like isoform X2 n=1 Tax=Trachinotus anak TaxID=443729 RepID=UPI0039F22528
MSRIKEFTLSYEALNEEGTFSEGDTVSGRVTLTLSRDTKVKCLLVKAKGEARVSWSEGMGDDSRSYSAHRRYFKIKECLVAENGTVLSEGVHHFKFRIELPQGEMPSSFMAIHGKVVYMLEAKLSRSWRMPSRVQKVICFLSRSLTHPQQITCPQSGSVNKEMGIFSKEQVQMSATVNRKVCAPGDTLSVFAKIHNSSSKTMRPKFSLHQAIVYRASGSTKTSDQSLCKGVGETIAVNSEETVSCQLKIPEDTLYSLQNCDILSNNYYLKVYLDIRFASDPEVVFPLVIVPAGFANLHPVEAMGPYPVGPVGGPGYSDFPSPAFPVGPHHQWPQQPSPYGFSAAP